MQTEACSDWKIDAKDPKICRNCKKPKTEHVLSKGSLPKTSNFINILSFNKEFSF